MRGLLDEMLFSNAVERKNLRLHCAFGQEKQCFLVEKLNLWQHEDFRY